MEQEFWPRDQGRMPEAMSVPADRIVPFNIEAEEAVLGSLLLDSQAIIRIASFLRYDDFYRDKNRWVYEAAMALYERREPIDFLTVRAELERDGRLDDVGGPSFLASLLNAVPTSIHIEHYARIVERAATRRRLITAASDIAMIAYDESDEVEATLDKAEQIIFAVSQRSLTRDLTPISQVLNEYFDKLEYLQDHRGQVSGVPTGFADLNKLLGGFQRSDLLIVAARPGMGKTGLLLSFAHSAAMSGDPVAIFSLEMAAEQLVQRLLSGETGIDQHRLRTGLIRDDEMSAVTKAMGRLEQAPIYIDDTPGITALEMRTKARRLHAERPLGLIVVDYLQLMHGGGRMENRVQEISGISRALKELARELNVPVVAASQLSRAVESRHDRRPMLSDLRESGCLAGDTLIYLPDEGIYRPIEQLVGQRDFHVLALNTDTWRLEPQPVTHAFSTGRKPVFRLATRLGREIRATANHQFLTIEGWRRLDELAVGQRLAVPRTLPGPQEPSMSDAELALLGHLIGDGCTLPRHAIQYTTREHALAEIVAQLATDIFRDAVEPRIRQERSWYQVYLSATEHLTHGVGNPVAAWLRELGVFGLRSHEKRVPDAVFRQPTAAVARFLRHLWATDGCIHWSEGKSHYANVYYASSSARLAQDVQSLLLRLGINARLSRHAQSGKGRDQFHVAVSGKHDIDRFFDTVGGLGETKVLHQTAIEAHLDSRVANTNRDVIPREVWRQVAVPAMHTAGLTSREMQASLGNAYCGTALYKQNLSRERAGRVAQVVVSDELARLAASDVYWDEIVAIAPDGEADVYDLTVDSLHNFVASNIVAHNSIEQDADIVMFIYRDDYYKEQTEKRNIAEVIVAKHRNGPTDTVELFFIKEQARFADLAPIADEYADSFQ